MLSFSADGSGRFDPPSDGRARYGTCYLSASPADAFLEKFGRVGSHLSDRLVQRTAVTEVGAGFGLRFADLTDAEAVWDQFTGYEALFRGDFQLSRSYGSLFFAVGFDGVRYQTQHRASHDSEVLALFGPPGDVAVDDRIRGLEPLKEVLMDDLLCEPGSVSGVTEVEPGWDGLGDSG